MSGDDQIAMKRKINAQLDKLRREQRERLERQARRRLLAVGLLLALLVALLAALGIALWRQQRLREIGGSTPPRATMVMG
jgi:fatty acid desaturase